MPNPAIKLSVALALSTALFAQPAAFEAVSIKLHPEPVYVSRSSTSGSRATWIAATLRDLVVEAYDLKYYQVSGGPSWIETAHFDIAAKAEGETAPDKIHFQGMLQALLADRFQLKLHREMKEVPVYALVVAKNGAKLKDPDTKQKGMATRADGKAVHIEASQATMQRLADQLTFAAGRPVFDKTGLAGMFAFTLEYSVPDNAGATESELPGMPTALQEQLGLKLEPQRAPIEILIVDSAEKPSAN